ncbi:hypothetical protein DFS33DRAFT_1261934, partial [Desarmillaria ectypa]
LHALVRDGFRCVVAGNYHRDTLSEISASTDEVREAGVVYTQCAHIVPEPTYFNVSNQDSSNKEARVLAILKRFGYDVEQLNGTKVYSLYNVMTMQADVHDWFDLLEIWFEKTKVTNRYRIRSIDTLYWLPTEVTFTTLDNENLPVPSETLLALHAACAKVAHFSGAAEYIDKLVRDVEHLGVLANNGSSGAVLSSAFLNRMNRVNDVGV